MGERESQTETAASVRAALDSLGQCDASMLLHRVQVRGWLADAGINDRALLVAFGELASEGLLHAWWNGLGAPMEDATRTISALGMDSAVPRALLAQVLAPAHPQIRTVSSAPAGHGLRSHRVALLEQLAAWSPPPRPITAGVAGDVTGGPSVHGGSGARARTDRDVAASGLTDEEVRTLFERFVAVQLLNQESAVSWEGFARRVTQEALRLKTLEPVVTFEVVVEKGKPRLRGRASGGPNRRTIECELNFSGSDATVQNPSALGARNFPSSRERAAFIAQVFARIGEAFVPQHGTGWTANLHVCIKGVGDYSVEVAGNAVTSTKGRIGTPSCVIEFASGDTFVDSVMNKERAAQALRDYEIHASNMGELRRFFASFDVPKALSSKRVPATVASVSPQTVVSAPAPAASSGRAGVVPVNPAGPSLPGTPPQSVPRQPDTGGGTGSAGPRVAYPALNKNGGPPAGNVTSPGRAQIGRTDGSQTGRTGGARIQTARAVVVLLVALCGGDWTAASALSLQCPEGFVGIRAGSFKRGSNVVEVDRPFCMQATEVTQGQYLAVMGQNPSFFEDCGADCPVEQVSWSDAAAYADALNQRAGLAACGTGETVLGQECRGYRLPTAAEWYYVAQASTLESSWESPDTVSWHDGNSDRQPHAVATKPANALGIYDMLGNLREWYDGGVILSGAWSEPYRHAAGVSVWGGMRGVGASDIGFRVVRSLTMEGCLPYHRRIEGACLLVSTFGTACTLNAECASGFCATGPDGTANDRCAPAGMNYIPSGTFTMGSPFSEVGRYADETQHSVTISRGFFIGQTEVTQGEWQAEMGSNPASFQGCGPSCPVEQVSWDDAVLYANALSRRDGLPECYTGSTFSGLDCVGYRLPTEAEWEYAARAGTTGPTYGPIDSVGWFADTGGESTHPVGGKAANNFGLYDMLGNVWEWTGDWYDSYPFTLTDPTGATTGYERLNRGGSWRRDTRFARAAYRANVKPYFRSNDLGFRLARTAP